MGSEIKIKYGDNVLSPTPTLSRSYNFLDEGLRYGAIEEISLACSLTGLTTPAAAISSLSGYFPNQFGTLQVLQGSDLIYQWDNLVLQEISFPQSNLPIGGFVNYNARFLSYQIPSGVLEPSNEYAFSQNEDGSVTVNHKISAKGIKTSVGAFDNAVNFVKTLTGKNPYTNCAPVFIPNGVGVLLSIQESINRAEAIYSVNETYKFTTGSLNSYIETTSLDINDSVSQDYTEIGLDVKWKGSPLTGGINALKSSFSSLNLNNILSKYNINSTNVYQNTFSLSQDSGAATLDIKSNFISGKSNDFSGYFDYIVSTDQDLITNQSSWKVDGDFICKGPLSFRKTRVTNFKANNQAGNYIPYLYGLVTGSAIYGSFLGFPINSIPPQFTINENTGLATLKLSATFSDLDSYPGLIEPKYSIDMDASKWVYELLPAANIEGDYTIQDLQMKSQAKMKLNMSVGTSGDNTTALNGINTILASVSGLYFGGGFLINQNISSGQNDLDVNYDVMGQDKMGQNLLASKIVGSIVQGYVRPPNFLFGY